MTKFAPALLAFALGFAPSAHGVDIEPYIKRDNFGEIKISPKGEYFAATVPLEDQTILVILDRAQNKVLGKFGMGKHSVVQDLHWVNPQRVVFSMAEKFGRLDQPQGTGELYAINADGTRAELLVGQRVQGNGAGTHIQPKKVEAVWADVIDTLPLDDKHVLIQVSDFGAEFVRAERMDVYTGRRTRVTSAPVRIASYTTDNAGIVRFAHGAEYDRAGKLYYRDGDGAAWRLINDEAKTGFDEIAIGFSADNSLVFLQAESEKGPDRIVEWNPKTGARKDVLVDETSDPVGYIRLPGGNVPAGAYFAKTRLSTRFLDEKSPRAKLQKVLEQAFPDADVVITSGTDDGATMLVHVSSDRNPGDYYVFNTKSLKADHILSNRQWFDPEKMNPVEPITVRARDGMVLSGYLTRAAANRGKRVPMVVMPHGGPFGVRDYWGFDTDAQMLAEAGYAVLQVNFRGSGGYGRAFQEAGRRQWGKAMQDDLTDATQWAVKEGIADGSRMCIYGASYGAYAALMGAAKEPSLYRCAVGYVGVYDMPALYSDGVGRRSAYTTSFLTNWVGVREDIGATSPTRMADRIKVPVLLVAGGEDQIAPIEHSKLMERALIAAGAPVETYFVKTEGHGFYKPEHEREFYRRLLAFLARSLGGGVAAPAAAGPAK